MSELQKPNYYLYDEHHLVISPKLAEIFGLAKAVFIQQVHYWILKKKEDPDRYRDSFHDGMAWVYNSARGWSNKMPYLGTERTVARFIADLKDQGVFIVRSYNKAGFDKTNWIAINYQRLNQITSTHVSKEPIDPRKKKDKDPADKMSDRCGQNDSMLQTKCLNADDKMTASCGQNDSTNTRNYTETTSETTSERSIDHLPSASDRAHENQLSLFSDQEFEAELRRRTGDHSLSISNASNSDRSDLPRAASGKVENSTSKNKARSDHAPEAFDEFWQQFPIKKGKLAAKTAWNRLKANSELVSAIMHDIANRKQNDRQWVEGFCTHAATYLNGRRWEDEIEPLTIKKSGVQSIQSGKISEEEQMAYLRSYLND